VKRYELTNYGVGEYYRYGNLSLGICYIKVLKVYTGRGLCGIKVLLDNGTEAHMSNPPIWNLYKVPSILGLLKVGV